MGSSVATVGSGVGVDVGLEVVVVGLSVAGVGLAVGLLVVGDLVGLSEVSLVQAGTSQKSHLFSGSIV